IELKATTPMDSLHWDETECLNYYGMLSLHEMFDVVASQLTESDIEALSFLLNETYPAQHPLDPFKSGLELLLELERRGYLYDGNLEPLLQLLRVLTRHDLLPFVSHKKRRTEKTVATKTSRLVQPLPLPLGPQKVSCDIRLRVRAEYLEHESALREGVSSNKRQPLERQFELFSRSSSLLRARDLGSIVCDIKFTELDNLEAFWADYLSGALLEALKGVFITDSLRTAAGSEGVRLLISVDQDDYEEGRRLMKLEGGRIFFDAARNG
uniref:Death effector domain-containing 1 n=1 Tax=Xiphophorus couchianus TaxID=32473 RepID=A0A3B5MW82_9TELE